MMNRIGRLLALCLSLGGFFAVPHAPTTVLAQEAIETEGTTDYRNPPILDNGVYRDTVVTGEAVWYAVVYTNDVPFRFEVTLPGVDPDVADELTVDVSFVGPTLGSVDRGELLLGSASTNAGDTNVWYLVVSLATTGQLGLAYEVELSIEGVQPSRFETCDEIPGCDLDDQLAELDAELADLEAELDAIENPPEANEAETGAAADVVDGAAEIDGEIAELEAEAVSLNDAIEATETRSATASTEAAAAESEVVELCGEGADCVALTPDDPTTPVWAWALGVLVLLAGLALLGFAAIRRLATS